MNKNNLNKIAIDIQAIIRYEYGLSFDDMKYESNNSIISDPKHLSMYLLAMYTNMKYSDISGLFDMEKFSVYSAIKKIKNRIKKDDELNILVKKIINKITK